MVLWTGYTLCFFTVFPNLWIFVSELEPALDWHLLDTLIWMDGHGHIPN